MDCFFDSQCTSSGALAPDGILPRAKFTLHPSFAFSYIGSVSTRHSSSGRQLNFAEWYKEWNYGTFTDGTIYIRLGGHHVGHRPTFLVFLFFLFVVVLMRVWFLYFYWLLDCTDIYSVIRHTVNFMMMMIFIVLSVSFTGTAWTWNAGFWSRLIYAFLVSKWCLHKITSKCIASVGECIALCRWSFVICHHKVSFDTAIRTDVNLFLLLQTRKVRRRWR